MNAVYRVEGMDCADCARHIEEGVSKLEGVRRAQVDFAAGLLNVQGDAAREQVEKRVKALGYRLAVDASAARPVQRPRGVAGFFFFLWQRTETRLVLAGGGLLAVGLLARALGAPAALTSALLFAALGVAGFPIARSGLMGLFINRAFSINLLMSIAALGAVILGDLPEAASLIFLFCIAEALEGYTTERARDALSGLSDLSPREALVLEPAGEVRRPVEQVGVGARVLVRPGERIPLDGVVLNGFSEANQAPITGESLPVPKSPGDPLYAGSVNGGGALEMQVTRPANDTTLARIVRMVTEAQSRRATVQRFIDRFAQVYTPAVIGIAVLVAAVPPLLFGRPFIGTPGDPQSGWFYRALALLVVACPCALVISAPVTLLSGIAGAARRGVLFKGGAYLEALAAVRTVALDKTGTLTRGEPAVTAAQALDCTGEEACPACDDVLALASALERRSAHPLARAVVAAAESRGLHDRYEAAGDAVMLNGRGLQGRVDGKWATVGSHALFDADHPHPSELCSAVEQAEAQGETAVLLCDGDRVRGWIRLADDVRPESRAVIAELNGMGLRTAMLTGDNPGAAARVAVQAGIDEVRAGLLPEDKVAAVRDLRAHGPLAMVGDGINDAPALAEAGLGIAVGGAGSAQAMETADVVLMAGDLTRLPYAVRLARFTRGILRWNIAFSLLTKAVFLVLAASGLASLWMAVLADTGVSLLVTLNGLRPLRLE